MKSDGWVLESLKCVLVASAFIFYCGCFNGGDGSGPTADDDQRPHVNPLKEESLVKLRDNWYTPRPIEGWRLNEIHSLPDDSDSVVDYRSAVVVIGDFSGAYPRSFGNGVIVDATEFGRSTRTVLTCCHLVERERLSAQEIRVGIFSFSFEKAKQSRPNYQEIRADLACKDPEKDLVLLSLNIPDALRAVTTLEDPEVAGGYMKALSIVPYGELRQVEGYDIYVTNGHSGSPIFIGDGLLFGIVQGTIESSPSEGKFGLATWSSASEIRTFLKKND